MCALQCDKMGVKWNSRFKKERGLDFSETWPSGSERESKRARDRQKDGGRGGEREVMMQGRERARKGP